MADGVRVLEGRAGGPVVLLLHGLGATADVWSRWDPVLAGRWVAPDLPGHGGSAPLDAYSFEALAGTVAPLVAGSPAVVVGHSLGGVLALVLAGRADLTVTGVVALGVKVAWTAEELDRARALSERPVKDFPTRAEAVARHLRQAGLTGLVDEDDPLADAGVVERDGRWRPALDPRAYAVGAPDLPALLAAARAPVVLARGEHDPMVTTAQLVALDPAAVTLPALGHNAHVENPAATAALLDRL